MAGRKRALPKLVAAGQDEAAAPRRQNRVNLVELAYERIEDLIVNCELKPGRFLAIQDLQEMTGFSRTPVHQAVTRLANDTLILVRPRHGVQIAPIDLARERMLLQLRRDLERFVIRLAAEKSSPTYRNQLLHVARVLRERRDGMTAGEFNVLDRRIDRLILTAAAEPFLEHTMRPLHTIFRRIGWIHHTHIKGDANVHTTIDCHLAILDAVANRHVAQAMTASDALIDFVDSMFDTMEREVDPSLLDCSLEPLIPNPRKDT
ncbi:DNA-binding GntR family transcriptional regulator [Skermanella aerolata]|uniref:Transcriptional regulator n=1 Tax=Skermanella aerolata TaxID=393310 RepID=A0A512DMZ5_9PROT|nr:GntR family transcriptional regulator [Skermanella aerolata]KJB96730.1 transcriptional regulator [Skermanella aerolata KACC 11604]GEO37843.1 transcriptional regulator [Skermanella aerolata]